MPTGGVTVENAAEWIKAGAVALGVGSSLTAGARTGDYDKVTETARLFIERIREARGRLESGLLLPLHILSGCAGRQPVWLGLTGQAAEQPVRLRRYQEKENPL